MATKKTTKAAEKEQTTAAATAEQTEAAAETKDAGKDTAEKPVDYAAVIRDSLTKTGREGIKELLSFMEQNGFFTAPSSGGNHTCKEGGLAEHSVNVFWTAEKLSVALYGGKNITKEMRDSITIAALLHDLGKIGDYDKPMYVENILKSGKRSDAKPYKRNPDLTAVPHAIRSIKLATLFIDLTEDEEWAILTHDGLYDFMKYEMQGRETWLSMLIHWADMWASHILEGGAEASESEG